MAFRYFKGLARRTASDEVLRDKTFNIAKNPKCDEFERGLASMVYKFFDKNSKIYGIIQNQQLAEEMQRSIIRNFEKKTKNIHHLKTTFVGLIFRICS